MTSSVGLAEHRPNKDMTAKCRCCQRESSVCGWVGEGVFCLCVCAACACVCVHYVCVCLCACVCLHDVCVCLCVRVFICECVWLPKCLVNVTGASRVSAAMDTQCLDLNPLMNTSQNRQPPDQKKKKLQQWAREEEGGSTFSPGNRLRKEWIRGEVNMVDLHWLWVLPLVLSDRED